MAANARFAEDKSFPFPLLCDTERTLSLAYGAVESAEDKSAKRISYVIGPDGTIAQTYPKVKPAEHAEVVLASL